MLAIIAATFINCVNYVALDWQKSLDEGLTTSKSGYF